MSTISTIVVFERDALLRRSLRILLETKEYSVIEVATSDGALQALRRLAEPCVLVVHHRLPEMDALMMLVRIANDPDLAARHRVVVIPSLGSRLHQPLPRAVRDVNVRIVPLPYELHTLHAVIESALRSQGEPAAARDTIIAQEPDIPPSAGGRAHWTRSGVETTLASPRRNPSMNGHVPPPGPAIECDGEGEVDGPEAGPGAPPV